MPMPKTAVDEDHLTAWTEDKIGASGQILRVETIPISHPMHDAANSHLGLRVLRADTRHSLTAFSGREGVEATVSQSTGREEW